MQRRAFIGWIGAAAIWPNQSFSQPARVPRVGYLTLTANAEPYITHFRQGLRDLGLIDGKNITVELKAAATANLLAELAADLVKQNVSAIAANQTPATRAAQNATREIPIIMAPAGDPVGAGFVASLAKPGGNITGVSATGPEAAAKTLELLRELLPSLRRIAVLLDATNPYSTPFFAQIQRAGKNMGLEIHPFVIKNRDELEGAFAAVAKTRADAAIIINTLGFPAVSLAVKHRIPAVGTNTAFADAGCVLAYAADVREMCHKAAGYVDRIFKGARPADLPVEMPTKYELVVNHKVARTFGMTVPQSLLLRADRVIE